MSPSMFEMIPPEPDDDMNAWRIPKMTCPHCGHTIDGMSVAGRLNDETRSMPLDGDPSVCFNCTNLLMVISFAGKLGVRTATAQEQMEFHALHGDAWEFLRRWKSENRRP